MEVEPRTAKQYKCHHCCSCKNYQGKGMEGGKKCLCVFFGWPEDRKFVEKMRFGASYSTNSKLLLVAIHILTTGLQKCLWSWQCKICKNHCHRLPLQKKYAPEVKAATGLNARQKSRELTTLPELPNREGWWHRAKALTLESQVKHDSVNCSHLRLVTLCSTLCTWPESSPGSILCRLVQESFE